MKVYTPKDTVVSLRKERNHYRQKYDDAVGVLRQCQKACDSLMGEYVSKKGVADWMLINDALCAAQRITGMNKA